MKKWESKPFILERWEYAKDQKEKYFDLNARENYGYYDGTGHWTADEVAKLTEEDRPITTLNFIFKAINALIGNEIANRNGLYIYPTENGDIQMANIMNYAFKYISQRSKLDWRFTQANIDGYITGMGFLKNMVSIDRDGTVGIFVKHINPLLIYLDPDSIEYDISLDAQDIHEVAYIPKRELINRYPNYKKEIEQFYDGNFDGHDLYVDEDNELCTVIYSEYKKYEKEKYWIVDNKIVRYDKDRKIWYDNLGNQYKNNITVGKRMFINVVPKIYGVWHFGDIELEPEILNPYGCGEDQYSYTLDSPYFVKGVGVSPIDQIKSIQDIINKSYAQSLDILNRQPKVGGLYESNAVEDPEELEEISRTGKWIEVKDINRIKVVDPPIYPGAHMAAVKDSISLLKEILGLPEIFLGEAPGRVESGLGLQILKRQSGIAFEAPADNLRYTQIMVGKKLINQIKEFWSIGKLMRIVGDDGNFTDVNIQGNTITVQNIDKNTGEPIGEELTLRNRLKNSDYDLVVDVNSPSPTQQMVNQMMAVQLFNQLPDPRLVPLLIDMLNFPNKEKWKQALTQMAQEGNMPQSMNNQGNGNIIDLIKQATGNGGMNAEG